PSVEKCMYFGTNTARDTSMVAQFLFQPPPMLPMAFNTPFSPTLPGNSQKPVRLALPKRKLFIKQFWLPTKPPEPPGMRLVERPEPRAAINDVVVQVHASGFVPTELAWPSTWTDRLDRDRTPSIPGHELTGVITALGYGTSGLSVGQRVFGLTDWYRDGTL